MASLSSLTLDQFNQQVLACQDEAFMLAISLVGEERLACQIVQEVILKVYTNGGSRTQPIDRQVLQGVILSCRRANRSPFGEAIAIPGWKQLKRGEREVLLLVDVLGKSYQDAASILNTSWQEIVQNVAKGRLRLARRIHAKIGSREKGILSG